MFYNLKFLLLRSFFFFRDFYPSTIFKGEVFKIIKQVFYYPFIMFLEVLNLKSIIKTSCLLYLYVSFTPY